MDMVWKMPNDQQERGEGRRRAAPQIYFEAAQERRGASIFLPFPPRPGLRHKTSPERIPALPPPNPALPVLEGGSEIV